MTYRDADPDLQARADQQLASEEEIENASALGREARAEHEPGVEKRLLHERQPGKGAAMAAAGLALGAIATAAAVGAAMPIVVGAGAGAIAVGVVGAIVADKLRVRRAHAWAARQDFPILGYAELLATRRVVTAITAKITLASIEPDDRERVVDLLGHVDTVDPVVTVDDKTIVIEALVSGSVQKFAHSLLEDVVQRLHEARRVVVVELTATTADRAAAFDAYR